MSETKERVAGRELDAIVAERGMCATWTPSDDVARDICEMCGFAIPIETLSLGRVVFAWRHEDGSLTPRDNMPAYSTDIAAAWLVVELMRADGWQFDLGSNDESEWYAEFVRVIRGPRAAIGGLHTNESAPLAICLAALEALDALTATTPEKRSFEVSDD